MEDQQLEQKIVDIGIEKEMKKAYLAYSMSVIVGRALPDVRDGLKPVHRRILYTMYENNLLRRIPLTASAPIPSVPCLAATIRTATRRFMTRSFVWRRIFRCVIRWWTGTETSAPSTAIPAAAYRYTEARMGKMSRRYADRYRQRYGGVSAELRRPAQGAGLSSPPVFRTCWSTALRALR